MNHYQFALGNMTITRIEDVASETAELSALSPDEEAIEANGLKMDEEIWLSHTNMLIETDGQRILIDAGWGNKEGGREGSTEKILTDLGITPDDIDIHVLSHAHADHFSGMLNEDGSKTYPNARYLMWRDEWLHYSSDEQKEHERERGEERLAYIEKWFYRGEPHMEFLDKDNLEIAEGVTAIYLPGHTRHHIGVRAESEGEVLLCVSDALIHPYHLRFPRWHWDFEYDAQQLYESREKIIEMAIKENAIVAVYHFKFPAVGRISEHREWLPLKQD